MNLTEFRATRRACDDKTWIEIVDAGLVDDVPTLTQSNAHIYANGYMIHEHDGQFYVHAWWYAPIAYDDLETAEAKLHPWYLEFV